MRANRSLTMWLSVFLSLLCLLMLPLSAGMLHHSVAVDNNRQTQDENVALAEMWWTTRDPSVLDLIADEEQLESVGKILRQWEQAKNNDVGNDTRETKTELASCSGYWGTYYKGSFAELQSSGYSYYWSPNCSMPAPGDDCGTDHNDYMVSFWMGPDYTTNMDAYRVWTTSWTTYWDLLYHGGASFRVYISNAYGAWYGNAYVCLSNSLDPSTLRFGRDY